MKKSYILSLDQGTGSSRALLFDMDLRILGMEQLPLGQRYPRPGWVEQDPEEIFFTQKRVAQKLLEKLGVGAEQVAAMGITNQRETTIVWDRTTGKAIHPAIVWQDKRTSEYCQSLKDQGHAHWVKAKTGLVLDPYFSASKLRWILDNVPGARERAAKGELAFGTVDSWLVWKFSGGRRHITDLSNASRSLLLDLESQSWDSELLRLFEIPREILPELVGTSGHLATCAAEHLGHEIPISGMLGDQQAALFGQACFEPGMAKNTYGTGCFLLLNVGDRPRVPSGGMLCTLAWTLPTGEAAFALEGSVFVAGAALRWLRDGLRMIDEVQDSGEIASKLTDNGGVVMVPAFTGIGAPHWNMDARGAIFGMSLATTSQHLVRASLEAIAYQSADILMAMREDSPTPLHSLRVDGGAARNDFLMRFQAGLLGLPVLRARQVESTAQGAAMMAGLGLGCWSLDQLRGLAGRALDRFEPEMAPDERRKLLKSWHDALAACLHHAALVNTKS